MNVIGNHYVKEISQTHKDKYCMLSSHAEPSFTVFVHLHVCVCVCVWIYKNKV